MSGWRTHLARLRAPIGTNGANGSGMDGATDHARIVREVAEALAAPDDDLAEEHAAMTAFYAAPASPDPYQPGDPDPLRDGLHRGFHAHRAALHPNPRQDLPR